jgi:hypothetical protein
MPKAPGDVGFGGRRRRRSGRCFDRYMDEHFPRAKFSREAFHRSSAKIGSFFHKFVRKSGTRKLAMEVLEDSGKLLLQDCCSMPVREYENMISKNLVKGSVWEKLAQRLVVLMNAKCGRLRFRQLPVFYLMKIMSFKRRDIFTSVAGEEGTLKTMEDMSDGLFEVLGNTVRDLAAGKGWVEVNNSHGFQKHMESFFVAVRRWQDKSHPFQWGCIKRDLRRIELAVCFFFFLLFLLLLLNLVSCCYPADPFCFSPSSPESCFVLLPCRSGMLNPWVGPLQRSRGCVSQACMKKGESLGRCF